MNRKSLKTALAVFLLICVVFCTTGCASQNDFEDTQKGMNIAISLAENASIKKKSISIDLAGNHDDVLLCEKLIGLDLMSEVIGEIVDAEYTKKFGEEFLFTTECMIFEIKEHIDGYLFMNGDSARMPSAMVTAYMIYLKHKGWSFDRIIKSISKSVAKVDIDVSDLYDDQQSSYFQYWKHIRPQYADKFSKN